MIKLFIFIGCIIFIFRFLYSVCNKCHTITKNEDMHIHKTNLSEEIIMVCKKCNKS